ncbi:aldehyde dehydrogenase family protein [Ensifer adhaerens]|uniref:aldehyde dehydrogenase family protein n=1 Tax=Ensifer adhaerens TaxID=106592 RepID=UPI001F1C9253|nr:aldehyde dehydrogenase family protein [Ensifer adhaerens]
MLAKATPTGSSVYFFTRDLSRVWRVAATLEAGMVYINEGVVSTEVASFGGFRQSVLGREGASEASTCIWRASACCSGGFPCNDGSLCQLEQKGSADGSPTSSAQRAARLRGRRSIWQLYGGGSHSQHLAERPVAACDQP